MATIALYLSAPFALVAEGAIQHTGLDAHGYYVVLDRTPAYPQGGGQPGDRGVFQFNAGTSLSFTNTRSFEGEIRHYTPAVIEPKSLDQMVTIQIDADYRKHNSVLHTAGHLIAGLASLLYPNLTPTKGHHFPDGSYVELSGEGNVVAIELEAYLKAAIQLERSSAHTVNISFATETQRLVKIARYPALPCGGTHVSQLSELPPIEVTKIKWAKNNLRISYTCTYGS
jgi:Ser-tRNA(Ala) deacylase AlaX